MTKPNCEFDPYVTGDVRPLPAEAWLRDYAKTLCLRCPVLTVCATERHMDEWWIIRAGYTRQEWRLRDAGLLD